MSFFKKLVSFLNQHVKDIILETENKKKDLIERLFLSSNFETTHGIIAMLNQHSDWTDTQIEDLCKAAEINTQVAWILYDEDVKNFYRKLFSSVRHIGDENKFTKKIYEKIYIADMESEFEDRQIAEAEIQEALEEYHKH